MPRTIAVAKQENEQKNSRKAGPFVGQIIRNFRQPFEGNNGCSRRGIGIGINDWKMACGQQILGVTQMPPQIGIGDIAS